MKAIEVVKDHLRPLKHRMLRRPTEISWTKSLGNLVRIGYEPEAVFDIGVAHGTWELYDVFSRSYFYLCDPDPRSLNYMKKVSDHLRGRCHLGQVALSDDDGTVDFNLRHDMQGSTLFKSSGDDDDTITMRTMTVRMQRFDTYYDNFPAGALVKIDVQGAEMMVLRGMTGALPKIGAILIEVSVLSTLRGSPEANEVIAYLHEQGFVLADIVGALRRPLDNQTAQMDLLFLPEKSPLRSDRRWG